MPYITPEQKEELEPAIEALADALRKADENPGVMNYTITTLILRTKGPLCYRRCNEVMGILECVKHEYYRRLVSPYEDHKTKENGDVYPENVLAALDITKKELDTVIKTQLPTMNEIMDEPKSPWPAIALFIAIICILFLVSAFTVAMLHSDRIDKYQKRDILEKTETEKEKRQREETNRLR